MLKDFEFKEQYDFHDLVNIMTVLRGPNGCPWDKEQTHLSIRKTVGYSIKSYHKV